MTCWSYHYTAEHVGGNGWECSDCGSRFGSRGLSSRAAAADHVIASLQDALRRAPHVTVRVADPEWQIEVATADRVFRGTLSSSEMVSR